MSAVAPFLPYIAAGTSILGTIAQARAASRAPKIQTVTVSTPVITPEEKRAMIAEGTKNINRQFSAAHEKLLEDLAKMGMRPTSGQYGKGMSGLEQSRVRAMGDLLSRINTLAAQKRISTRVIPYQKQTFMESLLGGLGSLANAYLGYYGFQKGLESALGENSLSYLYGYGSPYYNYGQVFDYSLDYTPALGGGYYSPAR